jgi:arabinofuranan 3-O-arabinosyltransferase
VRVLGVFAAWRLQAYGYTFAAVYAAYFVYSSCWLGVWLVDSKGMPLYRDFTPNYVAGFLALHGHLASIYVTAEFIKAQDALVGAGRAVFSIWPYPPIYLLALTPLAMLPYLAAFLTWELLTLLGCVVVVWLIVRRRPSIALVLASPFTAWNFLAGQSAFLTAALVGATLLFLERRPVLAGVFLGCLTYKPQFGILFPIALMAAKQWRAIASAAATFSVLAAASIFFFGVATWVGLPHAFLAQSGVNLMSGADSRWGLLQTVYGTVRYLGGGAELAWLAQGVTTFGLAVLVWFVGRSEVRYDLKAAILSAAALIATPAAFVYDVAAISIPIAFLAKDQISYGVMRGEQTALLAMFAAGLATIPTSGRAPIGGLVLIALLLLIGRRILAPRMSGLRRDAHATDIAAPHALKNRHART